MRDNDNRRRLANVRVAAELVPYFFTPTKPGHSVRILAGLPEGAEFVDATRAEHSTPNPDVFFTFRHPSFAVVSPGELIPEIDVMTGSTVIADPGRCIAAPQDMEESDVVGLQECIKQLDQGTIQAFTVTRGERAYVPLPSVPIGDVPLWPDYDALLDTAISSFGVPATLVNPPFCLTPDQVGMLQESEGRPFPGILSNLESFPEPLKSQVRGMPASNEKSEDRSQRSEVGNQKSEDALAPETAPHVRSGRVYDVDPDVSVGERSGVGCKAFCHPSGDAYYHFAFRVEFDCDADQGLATIHAFVTDSNNKPIQGFFGDKASQAKFRAYCRIRNNDGSSIDGSGPSDDHDFPRDENGTYWPIAKAVDIRNPHQPVFYLTSNDVVQFALPDDEPTPHVVRE